MRLAMPDQSLVPWTLRAMKTVALANGTFDAREHDLLRAVARIHQVELDVDTLETVSPEAVAAQLPNADDRERLVMLLILLSMIDGEATHDEVTTIESFAAALGVSSHHLVTLRKVAEGQVFGVRLDLGRRFWVREKIEGLLAERGVMNALSMALTMLRVREDEALATKYRALATYPEGTVGRIYHDRMRADGFSLPGEKGSPPEPIIIHDLTHVLSGYGTSPDGEVQTAAFHAGYRHKDPFTFLFFVMMQFHLGVRITPIAEAATGHFDPDKVVRAVERGAAMNTDLTANWDPWSIMGKPLEEARRELGIPPLDDARA